MKKRIFAVAGVFLLAALVCICIYMFRDSDEKRIRETLNELCSITSKNAGENPALGALKVNRADRVFAPKCRFNFKVQSWDGEITPTEIGARLVRVHGLFQWCKIKFSDLQILVNGNRAEVIFTGSFTGAAKHGKGGTIDEIRDIEGKLLKDENGDWKIYSLDIRQILDK